MTTLISVLVAAILIQILVADLLFQPQSIRLNKANPDNWYRCLLINASTNTAVQIMNLFIIGYLLHIDKLLVVGRNLIIDNYLALNLLIYLLVFFAGVFVIEMISSLAAKYYYDIRNYWSWMNAIVINYLAKITFYIILFGVSFQKELEQVLNNISLAK